MLGLPSGSRNKNKFPAPDSDPGVPSGYHVLRGSYISLRAENTP